METKRLIFEKFSSDHLPGLIEMMADEEVMKLTGFGAAQSAEKAEECLVKWSKEEGVWAIKMKEDSSFAGWIMLRECEFQELEIGFMFPQVYWGKGLATEAGKGILNWAFQSQGVKKIIGRIHTDNTASRKVLEKLGMRPTNIKTEKEKVEFYAIEVES